MKINTSSEKREKDIYDQYQSVISYFLTELEVRDIEYPIEIFNEIRATFTHLSRYKLQDSEDDLFAAERHVKRAILDCFKYMCISIKEEIRTFRETYKKVDLSVADNGKFLVELNRLEKEADAQYIMAKKAEIKDELPEEELYQIFEKAYNKHQELAEFLGNSSEAILFASNHTKKRDIVTRVSIVVTAISIVTAVIFAVI